MKKKTNSLFPGMGHPDTDVHYVYHKFLKKFTKIIRTGKSRKIGGKQYYFTKEEWRWTGYAMMRKVAEWAKQFPDYIEITRCDDDWHAGSDLVLIQHKDKKGYFGTTIVYIPQCTGEKPIRFFLYECHRKNLIKALQNIKKFQVGKNVS